MIIRRVEQQDIERIDAIQRATYPAALHEEPELFERISTQENAVCFVAQEGKNKQFERIIAIAIENAVSFWERQDFLTLSPYPYHGETAHIIKKELQE